MGDGNVMTIDWIMGRDASRCGVQMRDDLMAKKIKVYPVI
jgi:hypothetical protein